MSPWALLAGLLVVGALTGGAYWQGRQDGRDAQLAEAVRDEAVAAIASEAAASAAAAAISKISITHRTVRQELEREIQTREVYRDPGCRTGADSLQRFNSAIPGAPAASAPGGMPAEDTGH